MLSVITSATAVFFWRRAWGKMWAAAGEFGVIYLENEDCRSHINAGRSTGVWEIAQVTAASGECPTEAGLLCLLGPRGACRQKRIHLYDFKLSPREDAIEVNKCYCRPVRAPKLTSGLLINNTALYYCLYL